MPRKSIAMKRIVTIVALAIFMGFLSTAAYSQQFGAPEVMNKKLVLGGDANLGLAGNYLYVGIAPQAGFRLTRSLEAGVRLGYDLNYVWRSAYYGSYFCHYFSGSVYANYEVFSGIYLHVEDEEMCSLYSGKNLTQDVVEWYNSVFVGVGYRQYFNTSYTFYSVLYNLSWEYGYPYSNPFVIRVGYCKALQFKRK